MGSLLTWWRVPAEVRRCGMHWCPFWPYRMGSNPFATPESEAQLAAFENRLARR